MVLLPTILAQQHFKAINKMTSLPALTAFLSCEHADKCLFTKHQSGTLIVQMADKCFLLDHNENGYTSSYD